jgi:hypothetical protein
LAPNTTIKILLAAFAIGTSGCAGCGDNPLGSCDTQPDLTGHWVLNAAPFDGDAGIKGDVVTRSFELDMDLMQVKAAGAFNIGHGVWGTITSRDKGVFDTLMIPQLMKNNGGKTGAELNCTVKINVPIATPVSDDNVDQGPLRLQLAGSIVHKGEMRGDASQSLVIMVDDPTMTPRKFAWLATQP